MYPIPSLTGCLTIPDLTGPDQTIPYRPYQRYTLQYSSITFPSLRLLPFCPSSSSSLTLAACCRTHTVRTFKSEATNQHLFLLVPSLPVRCKGEHQHKKTPMFQSEANTLVRLIHSLDSGPSIRPLINANPVPPR